MTLTDSRSGALFGEAANCIQPVDSYQWAARGREVFERRQGYHLGSTGAIAALFVKTVDCVPVERPLRRFFVILDLVTSLKLLGRDA